MTGFRQWLEQEEEEEDIQPVPDTGEGEKIPFDISTDDGWHDYQAHNIVKDGAQGKFTHGRNDTLTSLQHTIWAAQNDYPPGSKLVCSLGGDDRNFYADIRKDPIISRLWKMAVRLVQDGHAKLISHPEKGEGYIFGRPDMVNKLYAHIRDRQKNYPKGWGKSDDYHRKFGQMVGYSDDAIDKFLVRLKAAQVHQHNH